MAGGTAGKPLRALQLQVFHELFLLSFGERFTIMHCKHLIGRPHMAGRVFMALQAPLHVKFLLPHDGRHLINTTVTMLAGHTFVDVDAVIKVDKVRQLMDPLPPYGCLVSQAVMQRSQSRRIAEQLCMAGQAGRCRWHAGSRAFLHRGVAIAAVYAIITHMMFVAERYGLLDGNICGNGRSGVTKQIDNPQQDQDQWHQQHQLDDENIGWLEDLRHGTGGLPPFPNRDWPAHPHAVRPARAHPGEQLIPHQH